MIQAHPFEPIVFADTRTLILGSFPSKASFEKKFYYAHPRNQFWKILSHITGYPINNTDQKLWLLKTFGLGLWDVIASCSRNGSLDSAIKDAVPNDIEGLLRSYPSISQIACTGKKALELFERYFSHLGIQAHYLPSPSPAHASLTLEQKAQKYQTILRLA